MSQPPNSHAQGLEALLHTLWKTNYTTILERLNILRDAQKEFAAGLLESESRRTAEAAAHKLAGVLGTFGLPEGSKLASKIEGLLAQETPLSVESGRELGEWLDKLEADITSKAGESKL